MPPKAHRPRSKRLQEELRKTSVESLMGLVDDDSKLEKHVEEEYPKIQEAWQDMKMRPAVGGGPLPFPI